ncbi:GGDEF domain-containing protein [Francisella sp. Scap27]|uniref:GGDEF domain-containing protein n=1 Tax=Francisella sp. Scap27 TaxID=2589986 RepID=UPI0015C14FEB|nr:GGDEF domain-containing protein [Francisella sp. Scap27]QLE78232.1 GGDEF domain-containing protein [Francisella sp. Scap27]
MLAIFAYAVGISTLHSWGQITGMAIHTAICFFILGSINYSRAKDSTKLLKLGEIVSVFIFMMFFVSWLFFIKYEYSVTNEVINKNAKTINLTIKNNIKSRTDTMLRLDSRVNWSAGVNYYFLKNDLDSYLDNFSNLKFIYFNKNGREYYFSNISISSQQSANIIKLCDSDESKDYCIKGNNNSFVAVFDKSLFKNLVDVTNLRHYKIIVKSPEKVVYSNYNPSNNSYIYKFSYNFSIFGQSWNTTVFFDESQYEGLLPVFPDLYFTLGFIISFIVLLLFYFADKFANKAQALREREKELEILSSTDVLTKTLNRTALLELLGLLLKKAKKENSILTVLYVDIDNFKNINDTYGHSGGDAVIVEVASRLQRYLKNKDIISRIGGDEFVVAFTDISNREDLIKVLDRMIKIFETQIEVLQGKYVSQTVSIGISIYNNQNDVTVNELINQADKAMYQAKKLGKNSYSFFK